MPAPVEITFLNMARSPAVEAAVERWASRLVKSFGEIQKCATWIELPHRHGRKGQTFRVRVEVTIPGGGVAVSRDPGLDHAHEDVYVAIGDAFRAARRQLQNHADIRRGEVKLHA